LNEREREIYTYHKSSRSYSFAPAKPAQVALRERTSTHTLGGYHDIKGLTHSLKKGEGTTSSVGEPLFFTQGQLAMQAK